ncbi:Phosphoribosylaminoimidazole carboxylase [Gloeopeniophorella convolvens]|nr:Phosphoribosylaminoimidazole carboxylase [Gloeopeniophorella convolvens]
MLAEAASRLNIPIVILDAGARAPAKQILAGAPHVDGAFSDAAQIRVLAARADVLTAEIEHVDAAVLAELQAAGAVRAVHPAPRTIALIQDKLAQKEHLRAHALPVADFVRVEAGAAGVQGAVERLGLPLMLKSRTLAYDGRGNFALREPAQAQGALAFLGGRPLYAEKWVPFAKEIAVMVVRSASGEVVSYPVVETVHKENICHLVFAPLRSSDAGLSGRARDIAEKAVRSLSGAGVFGVEMFLLEDGEILVNEIAPRPHNSGHYTIEACETSQYENHLRAILDLPLGSTALKVPSAVMLNILGASDDMKELADFAKFALTVPGTSVHIYGKEACRKGRKMGHLTVTGDSDAVVRARLRPLLERLPGGSGATDADVYAPLAPAAGSGHAHTQPLVGIIMGSDSDLPVMLPAARMLDRFGVPYELTIVSAHRTPDRMVAYARGAAARGLRVVVAGAGGAAHLPGMVAALTALPVIGVPVKGSSLDGVDSLHSIVQMPRGIPVATVAINNGMNAGLLAVRILSAGMPILVQAMEKYMQEMEAEVLARWTSWRRSAGRSTR